MLSSTEVRRSIGTLAALFAASAGCTDRVTVYVAPPWSKDQLIVLTTLDAFGAPRDSEPKIYLDAEQIELELPDGNASRLLARAYPRTLTGPNGSPASSCDISFNGAESLPPPEATWITPAIDADSEEVLFGLDTANYASNAPLGFDGCASDCTGYSATLVEVAPHIRTNRAVIIDGSLAYFAGRPEVEDDGPTIIGRIEGQQITVVPEIAELSGKPEDLVWDSAGSLWILTSAIPRRYTRDLQPLPQARINRIRSISAGRDGSVYLLDKDGFVHRPSATSTTGYVRDDSFPLDVGRMAVVRSDRLFAHAGRELYRFDGTAWIKEHDVGLLENVSAIAADDEVAVVAGEIENVRLRDETTGRWDLSLERPFDSGLRLRAAAGAGGGRFIVAGDSGGVAVWTGAFWCPLRSLTPITLGDIAVDPTNRYAYVAASDELAPMGKTVLVRVDMPPP